jgi:hypothetical protein
MGAVIEALETEAYVLGRAAAATDTADRAVADAGRLVDEAHQLALLLRQSPRLTPPQAKQLRRDRDDRRAAAVKITTNAAFGQVPLFDGRFRLRVGGGELALPDLSRTLPDGPGLRALRGRIGQFRRHHVDQRLTIVRATLLSTTQTHSMVVNTDEAHRTAAALRHQMIEHGTVTPAEPTTGHMLDLIG